jgi:hypothetical protein
MFQISFKDAFCGWHYKISFLSKILGNIFLLHGFSKFGKFVFSKKESFFKVCKGWGTNPELFLICIYFLPLYR